MRTEHRIGLSSEEFTISLSIIGLGMLLVQAEAMGGGGGGEETSARVEMVREVRQEQA